MTATRNAGSNVRGLWARECRRARAFSRGWAAVILAWCGCQAVPPPSSTASVDAALAGDPPVAEVDCVLPPPCVVAMAGLPRPGRAAPLSIAAQDGRIPRATRGPAELGCMVQLPDGSPFQPAEDEKISLVVQTAQGRSTLTVPAPGGLAVVKSADIPRGRWPEVFLAVVHPGYRASESVRVEFDELARPSPPYVVLRLRPASALVVQVTGPDCVPLPGVSVSLSSPEQDSPGLTDRQGCLIMHGIDPEDPFPPALMLRKPGYVDARLQTAANDLRVGSVRVTMAQAGSVRVRLVDALTGAPVPGALVQLEAAEQHQGGETNELGEYLFVNVPSGLVRVGGGPWTGSSVYRFPTQPVQVRPGAEQTVVIPLGRPARVKGKVVDKETGRPVPGVVVNQDVTTDQDGRFTVAIRPGQFLVFRATGYGGSWGGEHREPAGVQKDGEEREVLVQLRPGRTLRGHLSDAAGRPLGNAVVGFFPLPLDKGMRIPRPYHVTTQANGDFTIEDLWSEEVGFLLPDEVGNYRVALKAPELNRVVQLRRPAESDVVEVGGVVLDAVGKRLVRGRVEVVMTGETVRPHFERGHESTRVEEGLVLFTDGQGRFFHSFHRGTYELKGILETPFAPVALDIRRGNPPLLSIRIGRTVAAKTR